MGLVADIYENDEFLFGTDESWIYSVAKEFSGVTTCFESWGKEKKWNTSLCHPWASAPIILICEDLKGKFGIELEIDN